MGVTASSSPSESSRRSTSIPVEHVQALLYRLDRGFIVTSRDGQSLILNERAKEFLRLLGMDGGSPLNILVDLLKLDPVDVSRRIESGEREIACEGKSSGKPFRAHLRWIPESDWLAIELDEQDGSAAGTDGGTQPTVQELLQEREITYRNLLAAYLKLQEVNPPLAVIKGYYDLLLTGSLGKLSEKQRDILEESKESCERLVRLVSMFLNYSALESGKLVLQLRENDLRDCLTEISSRWSEAFQRKGVKLETHLDPSIPAFKFDYQKVQQVAFNLLDNALKHTPSGGTVTLNARPHFWERRVADVAPAEERRRFRLPRPNSVEVSVTDSGVGISPEHHQEIFEDFMRVDKNTSGMGLGLAIAKRLIQAHRGKIWVESESQRGSTFAFLLPMDQA